MLRFTSLSKFFLFLSIFFFIIGFLFRNLVPAFIGMQLLLFLAFTRYQMHSRFTTPSVSRMIHESPLFSNTPVHVTTTVTPLHGWYTASITDSIPSMTKVTQQSNKHTLENKPQEPISLDYQLVFTKRGRHRFTHVDLHLTDRWGFYTFETLLPCETTVMVHSDPKEIKKAKQVSTREHVDLSLPSPLGMETTVDMAGVRPYEPGDRLKDVEWKATSRLQKLMTKLFEHQEIVETTILLDCSRSMRQMVTEKTKLDHAANLALHLTKILQSLRHPVSLLAFDEYKIISNISASHGYQPVFEALTHLPDRIPTTAYTPSDLPEITINQDKPQHQQRFLQTVFPFLAQGKRAVHQPVQASGIYEAIRWLLYQHKLRHLVVITDMETNLSSLYTSLHLAHSQKWRMWLLTSFTPLYSLPQEEELTSEQLEHLYRLQEQREKLMTRFRRLHIDIVDLTPSMEGLQVVETIRRNNP